MTSIIIPVFNLSRYIVEALDSIRAQTDPDWEAIVVDDCSTDDSRAVVRAYLDLHRDPRIRMVELESNRGVSAARNAGIRQSAGEWLAFLDADDAWLPHHLATQCNARDRHPEAALFFSMVQTVDERGAPLTTPRGAYRIRGTLGSALKEVDHEAYEPFMLDRIYAPVSTVLVRKSAMEEIGGFTQTLRHQCEDTVAWTRVAKRHPVCFSRVVTAHYRVHPSSWSSRQDLAATYDIHKDYLCAVAGAEGGGTAINRALARLTRRCVCDRGLGFTQRLRIAGNLSRTALQNGWWGVLPRQMLAILSSLPGKLLRQVKQTSPEL